MPKRRQPGFTLIEVLVVIAVIVVLITIVAGSLAGSRRLGKVTRSLSTHQQLAAVVTMYCDKSREMFPYIGTPGNPNGPKIVGGFDLMSVPPGRSYFTANARNWASLIVPDLWDARAAIEPDWGRDDGKFGGYPAHVVTTNFYLAHACAASSEFWEEPMPGQDMPFLRGVALSQVLFPSSKGLILDVDSSLSNPSASGGQALRTAARVDGSAGQVSLNPGAHNGDGVVSSPYGALPWPVLGTRHGMSGRDF